MKAKVFSLTLLILTIALVINRPAIAQQTNDDVNVKVKNYSKTYPVDANDKLQVDNRYGRVTVTTWAKNEIKVDVQIKVAESVASNTQKQLDDITITDSKEGGVVSFKTNMRDPKKSSWTSWFTNRGNSYQKIEINYTISIPAKTALTISDHYGFINLPDMEGSVNINSAYGGFSAKSLTNTDNSINVSYGSANIENMRAGDLNVKYGSLTIGTIDKLNANVSYSAAKIGKLGTSGNINMRYGGGLQIADVGRGLKNLTVNSTYSGVKLGLGNDMNADFNVTVKYGSFNYNNHAVNITQTPGSNRRGWSPTQNYIGHLGKGDADKLISISTTYGSVKFE